MVSLETLDRRDLAETTVNEVHKDHRASVVSLDQLASQDHAVKTVPPVQ